MHVSIPIDNTIEVINVTEISPLISRCEIKVCYIGENRNKTVISKEVAEEMGKKLPGSPIVGYFNEDDKDFEQHNREIEVKKDGKFAIIDTTRPYGFVSTNAKVWFQDFLDDGEIQRTYLVTEGYIWTGVYPESERITNQGNNHSMELKKETVKGNWTGNLNSNNRFFIINEAVIEKLCVLGENFEPCFEGSQIKSHFSLEDQFIEFKNTMFSMINDLKQALNEGGSEIPMAEEIKVHAVEGEKTTISEEPIVEPAEGAENYKKKDEEEKKSEGKSGEEKPGKTEDKSEGTSPEEGEDKKPEKEEEKPKKKYNLEEVAEYTELLEKYNDLEQKYSALESEKNELAETIEPLKTFKLEKERESKQSMIDSFYMLSEEDKKDVCENIDTYSLEDIEAKLAVICVRNKVSFSLNEEKEDTNPAVTFNLNNVEKSDVPAWVKAVKQTASTMKN